MSSGSTPSLPAEITQFLDDIPDLTRSQLRERLHPVANLLFQDPAIAPGVAQLILTRIETSNLDFGSFAEGGRIGRPLRELAAFEGPDSYGIRKKARELVRLALPLEPVRERVTGESRSEQYELLRLGQPRRFVARPQTAFPEEIDPSNIIETVLGKKRVTAVFAIMRGGFFTDNDERIIRDIAKALVPADSEKVPDWLKENWRKLGEELELLVERIDNGDLPLEKFGDEQAKKSDLIFVARNLLNDLQFEVTTGGRLKETPSIQDSDTVAGVGH